MTGGTGTVGSAIVSRLLNEGVRVRILSRSAQSEREGVEWFTGSLEDGTLLRNFMHGAQRVFHCAAELNDPSSMRKANVDGSRLLVDAAVAEKVTTLCYISTVDVIGMVRQGSVDEQTPADPYSEYDKTKYEAEEIVLRATSIPGRVIVRPANVFDAGHMKSLAWVNRQGWSTRLKLLLQGRERPHLVHVADVAAAAIYLSEREMTGVNTFIVSYDDDPMSTYAGIHALISGKTKVLWSLPAWLPFLLRIVLKGRAIRGDALYSSQKLLGSGFIFPSGLQRSVRQTLEQVEP